MMLKIHILAIYQKFVITVRTIAPDKVMLITLSISQIMIDPSYVLTNYAYFCLDQQSITIAARY